MAKCKICGARMDDGAAKCPMCGTAAGATAESLQPKPQVRDSSVRNVSSGLSAGTSTGAANRTNTNGGTGMTTWSGSTAGTGTSGTSLSIIQKIILSICVAVLVMVVIAIIPCILNTPKDIKDGIEELSKEIGSLNSESSSSTSSSSYSSQPLSVMGFTGQSTRSDVKRQLSAWGVSYSELTGVNERFQGRVATSLIYVDDSSTYEGAIWSNIKFYFSPNDQLVTAHLAGYAEQDTLNAFNKMTSAYPVRTQKSIWHAVGSDEVLIKNGRNDNEYVERTIKGYKYWDGDLQIVFYF